MITYRFVSIESARIIGLHCIHSIDGWGVMIISVARKRPMRLIKSIVDHTRSMYESNAPSLLRSAALVVMLCVFIDTKYAVCTGQQRVCKPRGRGQLCIPTASHHRTSLSVCLLLMWCGWVVLLGPAATGCCFVFIDQKCSPQNADNSNETIGIAPVSEPLNQLGLTHRSRHRHSIFC